MDWKERMEEMKNRKVTPEQAKKYFESWRNVYRDKKIRGIDLSLLLIIKDTGYDSIFMTQSKLGELVGISRQATCRSLKNLEFQKYIVGNHPPKGTKKPVTYKLSSELVPPAKYIFFMNQSGDMNMNQSGDMKKNKSESVMNQRGDTNGYNGNKVKRIKKTLTLKKLSKTQEGNKKIIETSPNHKDSLIANSPQQMSATPPLSGDCPTENQEGRPSGVKSIPLSGGKTTPVNEGDIALVREAAEKAYGPTFSWVRGEYDDLTQKRLQNLSAQALVEAFKQIGKKINRPDFPWTMKSDKHVHLAVEYKSKKKGGGVYYEGGIAFNYYEEKKTEGGD